MLVVNQQQQAPHLTRMDAQLRAMYQRELLIAAAFCSVALLLVIVMWSWKQTQIHLQPFVNVALNYTFTFLAAILLYGLTLSVAFCCCFQFCIRPPLVVQAQPDVQPAVQLV